MSVRGRSAWLEVAFHVPGTKQQEQPAGDDPSPLVSATQHTIFSRKLYQLTVYKQTILRCTDNAPDNLPAIAMNKYWA